MPRKRQLDVSIKPEPDLEHAGPYGTYFSLLGPVILPPALALSSSSLVRLGNPNAISDDMQGCAFSFE